MQKSKEELSQTLKTQKQEQEQILKQQLQDLVCAIKSKCSGKCIDLGYTLLIAFNLLQMLWIYAKR